MQAKIDGLCAERDWQVGEQRRKYPGTDKVIHGRPSGASADENVSANTSRANSRRADLQAIEEEAALALSEIVAFSASLPAFVMQ